MSKLVPVKAKGWATSKTNLVALVGVIVGVLQIVTDSGLVPEGWTPYLLTAIAVLVFITRSVGGTQPVNLSHPTKPTTQYVEGPPPGV